MFMDPIILLGPYLLRIKSWAPKTPGTCFTAFFILAESSGSVLFPSICPITTSSKSTPAFIIKTAITAPSHPSTLIPQNIDIKADTRVAVATAASKSPSTPLAIRESEPEEELINPETGILALPFANEETPAFFDDVVALLPTQIQATVVNEEDIEAKAASETITLGDWSCEEYPKEGAYSESYTFAAALPEGYVLSEEAKALNVLVELGGAQMLNITGISYLSCDENGTNWTKKTCNDAIELTSE